MAIVVIWGPSGSGKTTNADFLKGKFAAKRVIDEWPNTNLKVKDGDLLLTEFPGSAPEGSTIIHIAAALRRS
jgi:thymidylate kinase